MTSPDTIPHRQPRHFPALTLVNKPLSVCVIVSGLLSGLPAAALTPVTFQVDMSVQLGLGSFNPAAGDFVSVAGDRLNNWSTTASVLTNSPSHPNLYVGTFNFTNAPGSTVQYKFLMGGVWERNDVGPGGAQNRQFTLTDEPQTLPAVCFDNLTNGTSLVSTRTSFRVNLVGADLSLLAYYEGRGTTYNDNGQPEGVLPMLKRKGLNTVRLRLFTSSAAQAQADPANYLNNLDYTVPLAVRVKNAGLQFLLDFHFSDTWADPGHQAEPSAWTNLTFPQLVQRMHDYSSNCIATFKAAGAMPDYVQVGNEINGGLLWPAGRVGGSYDTPAQWTNLARLLNAAVQGIKEAAGPQPPKIVIHFGNGADWGGTLRFVDGLIQHGVQFDIIGVSYYPDIHGPLTNLSTCLFKTAKRYHRPVLVAETAFPWASATPTNLYGIPVSTNGQVQYVEALAPVLKSVPGQLVCGVFWWGAEYPGAWKSFFTWGGSVLPVAEAFGQERGNETQIK